MTKYKHLLIVSLILILKLLATDGHDGSNKPSFVSGGSLQDLIQKLYPDQLNKTMGMSEIAHVTEEEDEEIDAKNIDYNPFTSIEVAKDVLELSQKIASNILAQSDKKYEVFSPISISAALHLALLGSNGTTYDEIMRLIGYNTKRPTYLYHQEMSLILQDLTTNEPKRPRKQTPWKREFYDKFQEKNKRDPPETLHQISVANGIFIQEGYSIRPDYKQSVESVYNSELKTLNFQEDAIGATKYVNEWVNEKTKGKIKELLSGSVSPMTRVILANALYFKALWLESFIKGATKTKRFYPDGVDGRSIDVKLMAHGGKFPYFNDPECDVQVLGLPYQLNITTMYVFLPNDSSRSKLIKTQNCLTAAKIERIIERMTKKTAVMLIPRLHLSGGFNLKTVLRDLGLKALFSPDESDLSLMSDGLELMKRKMSSASRMPEPMKQNLDEGMMLMPPKGDDSENDRFIFESRFGDAEGNVNVTESKRNKRDVTYKVESEHHNQDNQLRLKDFVLRKRIVKGLPGKKTRRIKRQIDDPLKNLEKARVENRRLLNPKLFAADVIHKVDLTINEVGTEGGAATAITLNRSGTNVVFRVDTPFLILIRHDPTRIPLFYGAIFEPVEEE